MRIERRWQRWRASRPAVVPHVECSDFAKAPSQIIDCGGTPESEPRGDDVIAKPAVSFRWRSLQSTHSMALGERLYEARVGTARESKQASRAIAVSSRCLINDCTRSHRSEGRRTFSLALRILPRDPIDATAVSPSQIEISINLADGSFERRPRC
jgi:hypothetical protein